jgi:hypothetical protein
MRGVKIVFELLKELRRFHLGTPYQRPGARESCARSGMALAARLGRTAASIGFGVLPATEPTPTFRYFSLDPTTLTRISHRPLAKGRPSWHN